MNQLRSHINVKNLCIVTAVVFILSLIPIFVLAFYNHPAADDFYYSVKTYHAFTETGSFGETLKAAGTQVTETYGDWQGTFSAVFLFALHPAVFGDGLYFLSTFILVPLFIGATLFLSGVILKKYMGVSTPVYLIISLAVLYCSIQFAPDPCQAFYWWNGSVYYTMFYTFAEILFSLLLLYLKSDKRWQKILCGALSLPLAVIVGGGNYVTALAGSLLLAFAVLYLAAVKRDKRVILAAVVLALLLAAFAFSVASPGNTIRYEEHDEHHSALQAIAVSFYYSIRMIATFSRVTELFIFALLCPFIYRTVSRLRFSFRYPLLFSFFSFCIYTAQFAPHAYAYFSPGPGRMVNLYYFSYFWLMLANLFYFCGWLAKKKNFSADTLIRALKKPQYFSVAAALLILVLAAPMTFDAPEGDGWDYKNYTMFNAGYSVASGEAKQFDEEYKARLDIYHDDAVKEVELHHFTKAPKLLVYGDLHEDPNFRWANVPLAKIYHKNYVTVLPAEMPTE